MNHRNPLIHEVSYEVIEQVIRLSKSDQKKVQSYTLSRNQLDQIIQVAYQQGLAHAELQLSSEPASPLS